MGLLGRHGADLDRVVVGVAPVSPWARIETIESQLRHFRYRIYMLITVGFILILSGLFLIGFVYVRDEAGIKDSTCQAQQTLVTQYEFFRNLALENPQHLSSGQVHQRVDFYTHAESLIPTDNCGMSLAEMQNKAKRQITASQNP